MSTRRRAELYDVSLLDYSGPLRIGQAVEQMQRLLVDWFNETRGVRPGSRSTTACDTGSTRPRRSGVRAALRDKALIGIGLVGSPCSSHPDTG